MNVAVIGGGYAGLAAAVTLAALRKMAAFADSPLVRQPRLSVVPLTKAQWNALARIVPE